MSVDTRDVGSEDPPADLNAYEPLELTYEEKSYLRDVCPLACLRAAGVAWVESEERRVWLRSREVSALIIGRLRGLSWGQVKEVLRAVYLYQQGEVPLSRVRETLANTELSSESQAVATSLVYWERKMARLLVMP